MKVLKKLEQNEELDENLKKIIRKKIGGPKTKNFGRKQNAHKPKTRKELRKEMRKNKKAMKHNYILNKLGKLPTEEEKQEKKKKKKKKRNRNKNKDIIDEDNELSLTPIVKPKSVTFEDEDKISADNAAARKSGVKIRPPPPESNVDEELEQLKKEMEETRRKRLLEENDEEDKFIRRMEKKLKLNKKAKIPASFKTDGLDYLLEICKSTSKKTKAVKSKKKDEASEEDNSEAEDMDDDLHESDEDMMGSDQGSQDESNEDSDMEESVEAEELSVDEEEENSEIDSENDSKELSTDEGEGSDTEMSKASSKKKKDLKSIKKPKKKDEFWEDIYGRLRRKDGSVVDEKNIETLKSSNNKTEKQSSEPIATGKYVPPMKRGDQSQRDKIKRSLKGLLNRLSEGNMHSISSQIEELYMANSRNEMNECMLELLYEALLRKVTMPERVVLEHIMLIAILHANIGTEIGAFFLQNFVHDFRRKYDKVDSLEDNKELENLILLVSAMYQFKIVDACLIYDLLNFMAGNFSAKDVELILTCLRSVGFRLRKDDPIALKSLIILIQQKASQSSGSSAKVKFMLDIVMAIRNNNMTKIPNYDPFVADHLQKIIKTHIHKGNYISILKIKMEDLINVETKGRWWIVGSAWSNTVSTANNVSTSPLSQTPSDKKINEKLLAKARALGMNTETRKNIFSILMTAEDYMDAFEKLNRLDLKNNQEREIIHVTTYCCLHEKKFNPYYALIASKFCSIERKFMYPVAFKKEIAEYASILGQRSASRLFSISQRRIFEWVKLYNLEKERVLQTFDKSNQVKSQSIDKLSMKVDEKVETSFLSSRSCKQLVDFDVEKNVYEWVQQQLPMKLSSTTIRKKALEMYRARGYLDIKCSYGWYRRWTARFKIRNEIHDEIDKQVLTWMLQRYDENYCVSYRDLQNYASAIYSDKKSNFKASFGWANRFFKRHHILVNWNGIYEDQLPQELEKDILIFRKRFHEIISSDLTQNRIGSMDEIPLSFSGSHAREARSRAQQDDDYYAQGKISRIRKLSVRNCEATVFLTLLADGTLLPPFVVIKGQNASTINQVYSKQDSSVVIFYSKSTEPSISSLEKWLELIWGRVSLSNLLLLDSYSLHESLRNKCESLGIVLELIPSGCSCKLLPVNSSAKNLFLKFMDEFWLNHVEHGSSDAKVQLPSTDEIVQWVSYSYEKVRVQKNLLSKSFSYVNLEPLITKNQKDNQQPS